MVEFYDATSTPSVSSTQVRTSGDTLSEQITEAEKYVSPVIYPVFFIRFDFLNEDNEPNTLYVNTSVFDINFDDGDGEVPYYGMGHIGSISDIEEGSELQVYGVTMQMSGVPTVMMDRVMKTKYRNRSVHIWFALVSNSLEILNQTKIFKGRIEEMTIQNNGEFEVIEVVVQNSLIDWEKASGRMYTHESQIARYPRTTTEEQDDGFIYLADMVNKVILWRIAP